MILGRLVGTVWATRKNPRLERFKLAIVRPYHWYNPPHDIDHIIAVDNVGAAPGQDVLVCLGQPGRWNAGDYRCPIEASVMGIVVMSAVAVQRARIQKAVWPSIATAAQSEGRFHVIVPSA